MYKITTLTQKQKDYLPSFIQNWLEIGLCTDPVSRARAEEAIASLYNLGGFKKRPVFVHLSSPLMCELFINYISNGELRNQLRDQLREQLGIQLRQQLRNQLGIQLWEQLGSQLGEQLWNQFRGQLHEQLQSQLGEQLWHQLQSQLGEQLWVQLREQLVEQLWEQLQGQLGEQLRVQLQGQLHEQIGPQLRKQLWRQLHGQLQSQLSDQLQIQLRNQLWGHLQSQLGDQLGDQIQSQVWDQFRDQLHEQLTEQIVKQLQSQIGDQLRDQGVHLGGQLREQLGSQLGEQLGSQLRAQLWAQFRHQLWRQLGEQLGSQLGEQLRELIHDQLWRQHGEQIGVQLRSQLWAQLRDQLGNHLEEQFREKLWEQLGEQSREQTGERKLRYMGTWFWGQQDAYWIAWYLFGHEIGVEYSEKSRDMLMAWSEIAKECHWFYPFREFCLVSDRPNRLRRDERGRLHSEDGMAISYSDGWGIYAWHGVRVPARIIEHPETISIDEIISERNAEVRRVMMYRYGIERCLSDMNAKLEQSDGYGDLYRIDIGGETQKFVKVVNATPEPDGSYKDYILPTWADVTTAHEAVARSFNRTIKTYRPEAQT